MNKAIVTTEINEPLEMEIGKAIHALEGSAAASITSRMQLMNPDIQARVKEIKAMPPLGLSSRAATCCCFGG